MKASPKERLGPRADLLRLHVVARLEAGSHCQRYASLSVEAPPRGSILQRSCTDEWKGTDMIGRTSVRASAGRVGRKRLPRGRNASDKSPLPPRRSPLMLLRISLVIVAVWAARSSANSGKCTDSIAAPLACSGNSRAR